MKLDTETLVTPFEKNAFFVTIGFFTIEKSDRSVRSDRNQMQFLRIFTI